MIEWFAAAGVSAAVAALLNKSTKHEIDRLTGRMDHALDEDTEASGLKRRLDVWEPRLVMIPTLLAHAAGKVIGAGVNLIENSAGLKDNETYQNHKTGIRRVISGATAATVLGASFANPALAPVTVPLYGLTMGHTIANTLGIGRPPNENGITSKVKGFFSNHFRLGKGYAQAEEPENEQTPAAQNQPQPQIPPELAQEFQQFLQLRQAQQAQQAS